MTDLTIPELTEDLLAWARDLPYPKGGESPLWRWQRWMRERPSDAWAVMNELVARAPADSEVMDHVARNAPLLIKHDFERFRPLVAQLLPESSLLASMVGEETFVRGYYDPRYRDLEELAAVWVYNSRHLPDGLKLREVIEGECGESLRVALEIIARGPLHGFDTEEVDGPLLDCLRHHGPLVIRSIEDAAAGSVAIRRAIWSLRRLNPAYDGEYQVPLPLWSRFQSAAGATTAYNTPLPLGERNPLEPNLETIVEAWFHYSESSWASEEVDRLVRHDPETGWLAILEIVRQGDYHDRSYCGAGPLEVLIREDPALFIERIESAANNDHAFQDALAGVWITLQDVAEPLARRYYIASGHQLRVIDAPADWQ